MNQTTDNVDTWANGLPTKDTPLESAVRWWADHGFVPIPEYSTILSTGGKRICTCPSGADCQTPGRHPAMPKGYNKILKEGRAAAYMRFKNNFRNRNVGLYMGYPDRVFCLDVDNKAHRGIDGSATLRAFEDKYGPLPKTLTERSGGGGEHRFLRLTEEQAKQAERIPRKIHGEESGLEFLYDTKVTVCPSRHHTTGEPYDITERAAVADCPDTLFQYMLPLAPEQAAAKAPKRKESVPVGEQKRQEKIVAAETKNVIDAVRQGGPFLEEGIKTKIRNLFRLLLGQGIEVPPVMELVIRAAMRAGQLKEEAFDEVSKLLVDAYRAPARQVPTAQYLRLVQGDEQATSATSEVHDVIAGANWRDGLPWTTGAKGQLLSDISNAMLVVEHDPSWKGRMRFNELSLQYELDGRPLVKGDVVDLRMHCSRWRGFRLGKDDALAALEHDGDRNAYHPMKDYFETLVFEGTSKIDRICADIFKMQRPDPLHVKMVRCWLISAVARVYCPDLKRGEQVDSALVLQGVTGAFKTSFFRELGGEYYSATRVDLTNKDSLINLHACFLWDWNEIEHVTTLQQNSLVKEFMTNPRDLFRAPYERNATWHTRRSVICGSTNEEGILLDETAARRFWIIPTDSEFDIELLRQWVPQIWAEAVHLYKAGHSWHLNKDEERQYIAEAEVYMVDDPWGEAIEAKIDPLLHRDYFTLHDVLDSIGLSVDKRHKGLEKRVGPLLRKLGCKRDRVRIQEKGNKQYRVWLPPKSIYRQPF